MRFSRTSLEGALLIGILLVSGCDSVDSSPSTPDGLTVDGSASEARTPTGQYIYWREHLIDSPDVNGGVDITGADGLALMDLDGDSREDIVSVHEDSGHVRVAFASADPNRWELMTLAHRDVDGAEDVVIEDLNGDTHPDVVVACERGGWNRRAATPWCETSYPCATKRAPP